MKITMFNTQDLEREFFGSAHNSFRPKLVYFGERLHEQIARMAVVFPAVCTFITNRHDGATLATLASD